MILINNSNILLKPKYDVVFQSLFSDKNKQETGYLISAILALLGYELDELKDLNKMHTIWHWRENGCNEKLLTNVEELHIIQMTKAKYEYEKNENNILAQWILFILEPNNKEIKSIMSDNNEIKETTEKLENISEDEDVRKRAEILERWELEEQWGKASLIDYGKEE